MNWVGWIVPLIALVVWILVNLLKVPGNNPPPGRQVGPRRPGENPFVTRPPGPQTDLDRFIEEAKRRREQGKSPQALPPPLPVLPVATKAPPALPKVRPSSMPTNRPRPITRSTENTRPIPILPVAEVRVPDRTQPPPLPSRGEPEPIIVAEVVSPTASPSASSTEGFTSTVTFKGAYSLRTQTVRISSNLVTRQALELLRNPNSARAAFILREVLDRPVSQRPRRR